MKHYSQKLLILFILAFSASNMFAQDDELDEEIRRMQFNEGNFEQEQSYFVVGAGYTLRFLMANYDDLNSMLSARDFGFEDLSNPVIMHGMEANIALSVIQSSFLRKMRVGIFSTGGTESVETNITIDGTDYLRKLDYNVGFWGFSLDYAIQPMSKLAILPGVEFGFGNMKIDISQTSDMDWANIQPQSDGNNWLKSLEADYINLTPRVNLEWSATDFLLFRGTAGYSLAFLSASDWKYNIEGSLKNAPDKLNSDGLMLQFGVSIGLFNM